MGPSEWTVISTGLVILIAGAAAFRALRQEMHAFRRELREEIADGHGALRQEMHALRRELRQELREEIAQSHKTLHQETAESHKTLHQEIADGYNTLNRAIEGLRKEIGGLRERMAKLEGLLEGLRESIAGRHVA